MRASVIIPTHNDGEFLERTVSGCVDGTRDVDCEIIVVDDASTDGSVQRLSRDHADLDVIESPTNSGAAAARSAGATRAQGDVLLFVDAHCKPSPGALARLIENAESWREAAIFTPAIGVLDESWNIKGEHCWGYGVELGLPDVDYHWLDSNRLYRLDRFLVSPALVGMCFALRRDLYFDLGGLDPVMKGAGIEDLDFGLRAWMSGIDTLSDPAAVVGHYFKVTSSEAATVPAHYHVNRLRTMRKNFGDVVWRSWIEYYRQTQGDRIFDEAWAKFEVDLQSAEEAWRALAAKRVRSEVEYAACFGIPWLLQVGEPLSPATEATPTESGGRVGYAEPESGTDDMIDPVLKIDAESQTPAYFGVQVAYESSGEPFVSRVQFVCRDVPELMSCCTFLSRYAENMPLGRAAAITDEQVTNAVGESPAVVRAARIAASLFSQSLEQSVERTRNSTIESSLG
ncbi:MAG: glycosyltransferase family 2 protein [Planctomycetota bacterium]|nr:MAG: glycosyltransferase family 2 protein [Planctomycetota bacterium]REK28415.1 MAG: glycosyltransferase family 2 protein [Planctomycetota bacterium]REK48431.1 MAG: glycosyltransferase family 2 protein [Planctomycetota bacterium]